MRLLRAIDLTKSCQKLSFRPRGGNARTPHGLADTLEIVPCSRLNLRVATGALGRCNFSAEHRDLAGCLICTPSTAAYVTSGMLRKETQGPTSWRIAEQVWRLKQSYTAQSLSCVRLPSLRSRTMANSSSWCDVVLSEILPIFCLVGRSGRRSPIPRHPIAARTEEPTSLRQQPVAAPRIRASGFFFCDGKGFIRSSVEIRYGPARAQAHSWWRIRSRP